MKNQEALNEIDNIVKKKSEEKKLSGTEVSRDVSKSSNNATPNSNNNATPENNFNNLANKKLSNSPILNRLKKNQELNELGKVSSLDNNANNSNNAITNKQEEIKPSFSSMSATSNKISNSPILNRLKKNQELNEIALNNMNSEAKQETKDSKPDSKPSFGAESKKLTNSPILNRLKKNSEQSKDLLLTVSLTDKDKEKTEPKVENKESSNLITKKASSNSPIMNRLMRNKEAKEIEALEKEKELLIMKDATSKEVIQVQVPAQVPASKDALNPPVKSISNSPIMNRLMRNKEAKDIEAMEKEKDDVLTIDDLTNIVDKFTNKYKLSTKEVEIIQELFLLKNKDMFKNFIAFKKSQNYEDLKVYIDTYIKTDNPEDRLKKFLHKYITANRLLPIEIQYLKNQYLVKQNKYLQAAIELFFQTDNMEALKEDVEKVLEGLKANKLQSQQTPTSNTSVTNANNTSMHGNNSNANAKSESIEQSKKADIDNYNKVLNQYISNYKLKNFEVKMLRNCLEKKDNLFLTSIDSYLKCNDESVLKKSLETVIQRQKKLLLKQTQKIFYSGQGIKEYELELITNNFENKNPLILNILENYYMNQNEKELIESYTKAIQEIKDSLTNNNKYIDVLMKVFGRNKMLTQDDFNKLNIKLEESNRPLIGALQTYESNNNNEEVLEVIYEVLRS